MRETGTYPEEFDFLPHSFTPCSVHCTHAKKLLKEWADTVKAADPDAARSLQEYNREIFRDVFDRNMSTTDHIILNVKKH